MTAPTLELEHTADAHTARLFQGDWLDAEQVVPRNSIDLLYADPPFNTGSRKSASAGAYDDAWPSTVDYIDWLRDRLDATVPLLTASACILIHVDHRASHRVRVLLDELLGEDAFVNHLIWSYGLGGSSPRRFARKHDDILFYARTPGEHFFDPPMIPATSNRMRGKLKKMTDVLDIPAINNMAAERTGYPTQKPIALLRTLVGACCPSGGVVLDPCCGSATTLAAALSLGRSAVGIDRSADAIAVARERLVKLAHDHESAEP